MPGLLPTSVTVTYELVLLPSPTQTTRNRPSTHLEPFFIDQLLSAVSSADVTAPPPPLPLWADWFPALSGQLYWSPILTGDFDLLLYKVSFYIHLGNGRTHYPRFFSKDSHFNVVLYIEKYTGRFLAEILKTIHWDRLFHPDCLVSCLVV